MKYSDGLFLATAQRVAEEYPDIEFEERIVDNMCMQLVQKPELYDVLVLPNLYGDIVSDLGAGIVGGLGVAPGQEDLREQPHGHAPGVAAHGTRRLAQGARPGPSRVFCGSTVARIFIKKKKVIGYVDFF